MLLLVVAVTTAPAADPSVPPPAGEEPITPIPLPPAADPLRLALGERLFADPQLSVDASRPCLSCHDIHTNGADAKRFDKGADGSQLSLNTLTVFNAALSFRLNWEGNYRTLEAQAAASLENPRNHGNKGREGSQESWALNPRWSVNLAQAYGHGPDRTACSMRSRPTSGRC